MTIDATIAKAKAAPSRMVKSVVWVMKPGPTALVAIRNMAPSRATRVDSAGGRGLSDTSGSSAGRSGVVMCGVLTVAAVVGR